MSASTFQLALATASVAFRSIEDIAREGARDALQKAIEDEVDDYLNAHRAHRDARGHRLVVRNGCKDPRTVLTGVGPLKVRQPRIDDRRVDEEGQRFRFTSKILPPYLRKLHLSLGELLGHLNGYDRSTKAGRRTAVNLCVHTRVPRIVIVEGKTSLSDGDAPVGGEPGGDNGA